MYIFGGRGVDGKDLGDLAAFKVTNQRWYMFQNMGPSPSGRSGHAMSAIGSKVYVLGGESFTPAKSDDPNIVHVLDTSTASFISLNDKSSRIFRAHQVSRAKAKWRSYPKWHSSCQRRTRNIVQKVLCNSLYRRSSHVASHECRERGSSSSRFSR